MHREGKVLRVADNGLQVTKAMTDKLKSLPEITSIIEGIVAPRSKQKGDGREPLFDYRGIRGPEHLLVLTAIEGDLQQPISIKIIDTLSGIAAQNLVRRAVGMSLLEDNSPPRPSFAQTTSTVPPDSEDDLADDLSDTDDSDSTEDDLILASIPVRVIEPRRTGVFDLDDDNEVTNDDVEPVSGHSPPPRATYQVDGCSDSRGDHLPTAEGEEMARMIKLSAKQAAAYEYLLSFGDAKTEIIVFEESYASALKDHTKGDNTAANNRCTELRTRGLLKKTSVGFEVYRKPYTTSDQKGSSSPSAVTKKSSPQLTNTANSKPAKQVTGGASATVVERVAILLKQIAEREDSLAMLRSELAQMEVELKQLIKESEAAGITINFDRTKKTVTAQISF